MKWFELAIVGLCTGMGLRSAWYWIRRPFDSREVGDHVLYAMYVTGRVGLWFAVAGAFAIFQSLDTQGRAFIDDANEYRWYVLVPGLLAFLQLLAAVLLGRRGGDDAEDDGSVTLP
jgi:hypothetical protein